MSETHNLFKRSHRRQNLQSFTFVGGTLSESEYNSVKHSPLLAFPNSMLLNNAAQIDNSVTIHKIDTDRDTGIYLHQLGLKPKTTVKIVNQTKSGSVIVNLGKTQIGLGSTITKKIVVTLASEK